MVKIDSVKSLAKLPPISRLFSRLKSWLATELAPKLAPKLKKMKRFAYATLAIATIFFIVVYALEVWLASEIKPKIDGALRLLAPKFNVTYSDVKVNLFSQTLSLTALSVSSEKTSSPVQIGRASVGRVDWQSVLQMIRSKHAMLPRSIWFALEDVQIERLAPVTAEPGLLEKLGIAQLKFSLSSRLRMNIETGLVAIEDLILSADRLGELEFAIELRRVAIPSAAVLTPAILKDHEWLTAQTAEWKKIELASMQIKYVDSSLIKKLDAFLESQGEPPLSGFIEIILQAQKSPSPTIAPDQAVVESALSQLKKFTDRPRSLVIRIAPIKNVNLAMILEDQSIIDVQAMANLLGLTVEAN